MANSGRSQEKVEEKEVIEDELDEEENEKLPFPNAVVVRLLRQHISKRKQIKKRARVELNIWLGKMVEQIAKKLDSYPYSYVDYSMVQDALKEFEKMKEISAERERIIKYLEKIKADCESLELEVDRKFKQD